MMNNINSIKKLVLQIRKLYLLLAFHLLLLLVLN